jgi:hypothetical protein
MVIAQSVTFSKFGRGESADLGKEVSTKGKGNIAGPLGTQSRFLIVSSRRPI